MNASPQSAVTDSSTSVTSLRTQYPTGLIGVPAAPVRLSWKVSSDTPGSTQVAYEIETADAASFASPLATSGAVDSSAAIAISAPLSPTGSRETLYYRVRIATEAGWTGWSPIVSVETGLTDAADWTAVAIGVDSVVSGPSPILRTDFRAKEAPVRARLYATSLGLNEIEINGSKVGIDLLAPGWTAYKDRFIVSTFDVSDLVTAGANAIGGTIADGWYRGRLGWEDLDSLYGTDLALVAQLELEYADGSVERVVTDTSWTASWGVVTSSGIYDGTDFDFSLEQPGWTTAGFDASAWSAVREIELDLKKLDPAIALGVREIATFPMVPLGPVLDAGQNIAGWVRLVVNGKKGDVVKVRHAEVLEPDGTLHTRSLRGARAQDHYTLATDGEVTLESNFTFHGFRYADVEGAEVVSATAVAISSAISERGSFESSEAVLNRLHANVQWSQRDNFVSVPTDCPQRDERMGWTGDAQAFAMTASTLFDTEAFWESWLVDLELDQAADGGVAAVVPNILTDKSFLVRGEETDIMGRAGWADAATIVPWSLYESIGTTLPLERQLSSMRRWIGYLVARRGTDGLLPTEFQFGDWLDPDAPGSAPWEAKVSSDFVSNAFFVHSTRILARSEELVGDPSEAAGYDALADEVAAATWAKWGEHAITTQTGCALALEFRIAPTDQREAIAQALADNVNAEDGRIATGFLGTPVVLHALSNAGKLDEAYRMLLRHELPSWLYQVDMGATTVWERWDALQADGSIHPGNMDNKDDAHMLSFNHYAYGAVIDWVYRVLGGLAPTIAAPGYERTIVAPRPVGGIDWASTSIETSFGALSIDWKIADGAFEATIVVPFGVTAAVSLPATGDSVVTVDAAASAASFELTHGTYTVGVTNPAVAARSH
jgi:alpha-L-rhamnosidase